MTSTISSIPTVSSSPSVSMTGSSSTSSSPSISSSSIVSMSSSASALISSSSIASSSPSASASVSLSSISTATSSATSSSSSSASATFTSIPTSEPSFSSSSSSSSSATSSAIPSYSSTATPSLSSTSSSSANPSFTATPSATGTFLAFDQMSSVKFSIGIFGGLLPSNVDTTGGLEGGVSNAIRIGLSSASRVLESERYMLVKSYRLLNLSSIINSNQRRRLLDGATQGVELDLVAYAPTFSLIKNASSTLSIAIKDGPNNNYIADMLYNTAVAANIPPPLTIRLTKEIDLFDRFPSPSPSPPPPISPEGWGALWGGIAGALVLLGAVGLSWRIVTIRNKKTFAAAKELEFLETNKKAFERINRLAVLQGRVTLSKEEQEALDRQDAEDEKARKGMSGTSSKEKVVPKTTTSTTTTGSKQSPMQITLHFDEDDDENHSNDFKIQPFGLSSKNGIPNSSNTISFEGSNPMLNRAKKFESKQSFRFGTQTKARGRDGISQEVSTTTTTSSSNKNDIDDEFGPTTSSTRNKLSRMQSSRRQLEGSSQENDSTRASTRQLGMLTKSTGLKTTMSSRFLSMVGLGTLPNPSSMFTVKEDEDQENQQQQQHDQEIVSGINPMKLERKPTAAPAALIRTKSELRQARQAAMIKPKLLEKDAKLASLQDAEKTKTGFFGQVFGINTGLSSTTSSSDAIEGVNPMLSGNKPMTNSSSSSSSSETKNRREKVEVHYLEKAAQEREKVKQQQEFEGGNNTSGVGMLAAISRGIFGSREDESGSGQGEEFVGANPMRAPPHTRSKTSFDALPTQQRSKNTGMSRRNLALFSSSSSSSSSSPSSDSLSTSSTSTKVRVTPHYLEKTEQAQKKDKTLGVDPFAIALPEEEAFEAANPMKQNLGKKRIIKKELDADQSQEETKLRMQVSPKFLEKEAKQIELQQSQGGQSQAIGSNDNIFYSGAESGDYFSNINPMAPNHERNVAPPLQLSRPIVGQGGLVGRGKIRKPISH